MGSDGLQTNVGEQLELHGEMSRVQHGSSNCPSALSIQDRSTLAGPELSTGYWAFTEAPSKWLLYFFNFKDESDQSEEESGLNPFETKTC